MKSKIVGITTLIAFILLSVSNAAAGREPPVAKLVQVSGEVEYSRNGTTWRDVKRTKYLFSGYRIKTGADGGGKLIDPNSGMAQSLGPNSQIEITDTGVTLVSGSLSKPEQESSSIFQGLSNKFAKAQRYTTVRRSVTTKDEQACDNKVRTIRKVTLSASFPDLVWRNACPEFSYRLIIDGQVHDVAAHSNAEMIRYSIAAVSVGEHTYRVEVLDNDGTVYIPRKDSTFIWIDGGQEKKILTEIKGFGDDVFLSTNLFESENMYIAAMDTYREYFNENPDDNDMRPLLIQSYQDLKLSDLRVNEARLYNAMLEEDF